MTIGAKRLPVPCASHPLLTAAHGSIEPACKCSGPLRMMGDLGEASCALLNLRCIVSASCAHNQVVLNSCMCQAGPCLQGAALLLQGLHLEASGADVYYTCCQAEQDL